jgi:hypothetical protein
MNLDELCSYIRETHRQREDLQRAQTAMTLRIKAICRRAIPETDKHQAGDKREADKLYKALVAGEVSADDVAMSAFHLIATRSTLSPHIKALEKQLIQTAKELPVFDFVESVHGFGWIGLAQIVGEAGNLWNYSKISKLWKRMGLAPYNGKSCAEWRRKGGLTALDWEDAGYSPSRRSKMFSIGDSLIKKQNDYRELYLQRKIYEQNKAPDLMPMAHHRRAQRYMEKRLLKDLMRAWKITAELRKAA